MTTVVETDRKVYWAGKQWCVTDYGLETIVPDRYFAEAARLGDLTEGQGRDERPGAERLRHIGTKTWVDIEDLAAAFAVALQVHEGRFPALPKGAFHNTLADLRYKKTATEVYRSLASEKDRMGTDAVRGFEKLQQSEQIMADRYPDRAIFYEVVTLPPPED